ncbi:Hsp70 family protein [Actinomadura verrucosospora]|uniref:Heat shock protein 70 n=1 Tax=Actinomadura verrucosospora TaxID=46165 RepID=A0A7D3VXQ1_ACTVE|nr:Hsp70 family protein [Actinomadura verrucosospora]QKG21656.1 heat shock protein 70 [Actinomadura verrucosospora]
MTTRIGIDFGTANTVVAGWDHGADRAEPVPLPGLDLEREGADGVRQRVVPSRIAFSATSERRWVGAQVTPRIEDAPATEVFQSTKSAVTGRAVDVPRRLGGRAVTGRQAATRFLGDVMAAAVLAVDTADLEIVATAPVESFDAYRDWLVREVGESAGGARLRVVDEATAAAVGYSARLNPGEVFLVFDFGAGTLDTSVVKVMDPANAAAGAAVRTIAKAGLDLGGDHIDALLAEHAAARAGIPLGDTAGYNRLFRALLRSAEQAKIALTVRDSAVIEADGHRTELTRAEFDALLRDRDVLGRVSRALRRTLDGAAAKGYPADAIAKVFLVGGTSLIPAVQDALRLQFPPDALHLDRPLEAVAAGAASIAGGYELSDHIQHDYAIRHVDAATGAYEFETLVEAGTEYPTSEPVKMLTIKAIRDGQRRLGIAVYELAHASQREGGADLEIVFDADGGARTSAVTAQRLQERSRLWLNEDSPTFLEADPPAEAGAPRFRLDFRVDAQKRLTVSAFDLHRNTLVLDRQPVVRLS